MLLGGKVYVAEDSRGGYIKQSLEDVTLIPCTFTSAAPAEIPGSEPPAHSYPAAAEEIGTCGEHRTQYHSVAVSFEHGQGDGVRSDDAERIPSALEQHAGPWTGHTSQNRRQQQSKFPQEPDHGELDTV